MSDNKNIWFTADTHFSHKNILKYCSRNSSSLEEHDNFLMDNWNSLIKPGDNVYHLGDFSLCNAFRFREVIDQLNGNIHLIRGNHDRGITAKKFVWVKDYYVLSVPDEEIADNHKQKIVLMHYPITSWNGKFHGAWMCHGHCVDLETEILTEKGWKYRHQLNIDEAILTLNIQNMMLEYNVPYRIIDIKQYSGNVVSCNSRHTNFRVTDGHTMLDVNRTNHGIRKFLATDFDSINKRLMLHAGIMNPNSITGINLSDNMLRLLIWITADGNKCNSSLIRIRLLKERKINSLKILLSKMNIPFRALISNGMTSINFTIPHDLISCRLKPLDQDICNATYRQCKIILEEYAKTDGSLMGDSCYNIYTSKPKEVDILQEMLFRNGFRCKVTSRIGHGFSTKPSYTLSIVESTMSETTEIKEKTTITLANKEHFWCVSIPNETIITRRNGTCLIMGNCHGNLENHDPARLDVGVDCHNFNPISYEEVKIIITKKLIAIKQVDGFDKRYGYTKESEG